MEKVYLLQNRGLFPTSSYYDTIEVFKSKDDALNAMNTCHLDLIKQIDSNGVEGFNPTDYDVYYGVDDDVDYCIGNVGEDSITILNKDGWYEQWWVEEFNIK